MSWGWYVPLAFLGLLLLLLFTRARIGFAYEDRVSLWVGFGFFKLTLLPASDRKKSLKAKKEKPEKQEKEKKKKSALAAEQKFTLQEILQYARFGIDAMGKTTRCLVFDELTVHAIIGTDDAAKTAISYGATSAALSAFYPVLASRTKIRRQDLRVDADFSGNADLLVRIRISAMAFLLMIAGLRILFSYLRLRKQHTRQQETGKAVNT